MLDGRLFHIFLVFECILEFENRKKEEQPKKEKSGRLHNLVFFLYHFREKIME